MSAPPGSPSADDLRRRRAEMAKRVAALTFDLGWLTYEMAMTGRYRREALDRRAAELRTADAELGELERLVAALDSGVAGHCRRCSATHARSAIYCWRCGEPLAYAVPPAIEG